MTWRWPATVLLLCVAGMAFGADTPESGALARWIFVVSALAGVWACWRVAHTESLTLRHVIGLAILCRIIAFPLLPTLSDDGYRYIWDGALFAQYGISPYAFVPSNPELALHQLDAIYLALNSPDYFSVYPPVSQAVFALGGLLNGLGWQVSWYAIKFGFVSLEAVGVVCLVRVATVRGIALYALHPIPVIEIAGQGHTEGALVCALGLAVWSFSRWPMRTGAALAMAGWVKLFPLALAPLLGRLRRGWWGWLLGVALGLLCLAPQDGIAHILTSVRLYGGSLDFYAAPFLFLKAVFFPFAGELSGRLAAVVLSLVWGGLLLGVYLTRNGTAASFRTGLAVGVVTYALLSPMQHPWNWIGVLFVIPLLQGIIPLYWIASISLMTYLRYVGFESLYLTAIVIGWGGGFALAIRELLGRTRYPLDLRASRRSSTDAVSASSHM